MAFVQTAAIGGGTTRRSKAVDTRYSPSSASPKRYPSRQTVWM